VRKSLIFRPLLLLGCIFLASCGSENRLENEEISESLDLLSQLAEEIANRSEEATQSGKRIIICADANYDPDDVVALCLAHELMSAGFCQIIATVSCSQQLTAEGIAAINAFYGRDDIPVGVFDEFYHSWDNPLHQPNTSLVGSYPDDLAAYPHGPTDGTALAVLQSALEGSPDDSVTIVTIGFLTNMEQLLDASPELIEAKVNRLVVMGGNGSDFRAEEHNVLFWPNSATTISTSWPTPITAIGVDVSGGVVTASNSGRLAADHPIRIALAAFNQQQGLPSSTGRFSPDPMAVWEAVMENRDSSDQVMWSYRGNINIHWQDGLTTTWQIGPHRYLTAPFDNQKVVQEIDRFAMGEAN